MADHITEEKKHDQIDTFQMCIDNRYHLQINDKTARKYVELASWDPMDAVRIWTEDAVIKYNDPDETKSGPFLEWITTL